MENVLATDDVDSVSVDVDAQVVAEAIATNVMLWIGLIVCCPKSDYMEEAGFEIGIYREFYPMEEDSFCRFPHENLRTFWWSWW